MNVSWSVRGTSLSFLRGDFGPGVVFLAVDHLAGLEHLAVEQEVLVHVHVVTGATEYL